MAAATVPLDGSLYLFQFSTDAGTTWKDLGYQKESGLQIATESREITSKTQATYREKLPTVSTWSISGTAEYYNSDDIEVFDDVFATRGTVLNVRLTAVTSTGTAIVGESRYTGEGFWTSLDVSFPEKDTASYSYTFEGTGVLTKSVIV